MPKTELYEAMVIFDATGDESETRREFDVVQSLIERHSAKFVGRKEWGHKELVYPIKKKKSGWYIYYLFEAESGVPSKLTHALAMDERILRHIIVRAKPAYAQQFLSKTESGYGTVSKDELSPLPHEEKSEINLNYMEDEKET